MIKDNNKEIEYSVRKKIKDHVLQKIDTTLNNYHERYKDDIGFLLYYPLYYFEFDLLNSINISIENYVKTHAPNSHDENLLMNYIVPVIQLKKMKNLNAITWFIKEMRKRGYENTKKFIFDYYEFEHFKIIYNSILDAYDDYENSIDLLKLRNIAGFKLVRESESTYTLIKPNIIDNYYKDPIYFYGLYDDDFEEEKVKISKSTDYLNETYNVIYEMICGPKENWKKVYKTVNELAENIDKYLYGLCIERVEVDVDKLSEEFKSQVIYDAKELKLFLGYLYYLSRVTLHRCNMQHSLMDDYRKNLILKYNYYDLIKQIEYVTSISRERVKLYLEYFTLPGNEIKNGTLVEFPIIRYKNRVLFLPSTFILNDFQFTITNGHYFKNINVIRKDETISNTLEDSIEKKIRRYSNVVISTRKNYNVESVKTKNGKDLKSDIDVAIYDKISNQILIIECKWKENVYIYKENYINILDCLNKVYENQLDKHKEFIELDASNIDFIFDYNVDVMNRKENTKINYLFVDKRIQYHKDDRHALSVYLFLYLVSEYSNGNILHLDKLVNKINSLNTSISYEKLCDANLLSIDDLKIKHNAFNLEYKFDISFYGDDYEFEEDYEEGF